MARAARRGSAIRPRVPCHLGDREKKGYSGVATFSRFEPDETVVGMGIEQFDREGRVVVSRWSDITLVNAYFPNGQRDHARLPYKTEFYRAMFQFGADEQAKGRAVIICGDWNTAHHEIDLKNWKSNRKTSGFTDFERELVTEFTDAGYKDAFRTLTQRSQTGTPGGQIGQAYASEM